VSLQREWFGEFSVLRRPSQGEGAVAVHFAHATGFNANTYAPLLESLDPSIDVYAMDARGHGLSKASAVPRKLRTWKRYVRDLESLVATIPRPAVLVGHSMGGTVSLEVAAANPAWIAGVVLVDPVLVPPSAGWWVPAARAVGLTRRVPIARAAAKRRMEFPSKEAAVENFEGKGAFRTWPREWIEAYVEGGTVPTDNGIRMSCDRAWESQTFAVATPRPYGYVKRLRCPTTLIARETSGPPLSEESCNAFMRARPDTRLIKLESASHFMTMERPDLVRDEIHRMAATVRSEL
jgi:pimeloyl-ACP methyl ester carboxylesterase